MKVFKPEDTTFNFNIEITKNLTYADIGILENGLLYFNYGLAKKFESGTPVHMLKLTKEQSEEIIENLQLEIVDLQIK